MNSILKKTILIVSLAFASVSSFSPQAASVCRDDPRMFTIKTVLDDMEAGKQVEPIKLTQLTFLELTENVRNKLGDNIRVYDSNCIPTQIYEGKLAKPFYLPFAALEQGLHTAALRGDKKTIEAIFQQFRAEPKSTADIIYMARPITWTEDAAELLYQTGKMEKMGLPSIFNADEQRICKKVLSPITQVELFAKLGGKAIEKEDVISYSHSFYKIYGFATIRTEYIEYSISSYQVGSETPRCNLFEFNRTTNAISNTGLNVINSDENLKDSLSAYKENKLNNEL